MAFLQPNDLIIPDFSSLDSQISPTTPRFQVFNNYLTSLRLEPDSEGDSIHSIISKEIRLLQAKNEESFFALNPEKDFRTRIPHPPPLLDAEVDVASDSTFDTKVVKPKLERNILSQQLFFMSTRHSTDNKTRNCCLAPKLSSEVIKIYDLVKSEMAQVFRDSLTTFFRTEPCPQTTSSGL